MISPLTALAALVVALVALVVALRRAPAAAGGAGRMKLNAGGALSYASGVSGTYTVPAGAYVLGVTCHATTAGALTLNPTGGSNSAIPLPAGSAFSIAEPLLGTNGQLVAGSTIVFAGTDSYVVVLG